MAEGVPHDTERPRGVLQYPLHVACRSGALNEVRRLLAEGRMDCSGRMQDELHGPEAAAWLSTLKTGDHIDARDTGGSSH